MKERSRLVPLLRGSCSGRTEPSRMRVNTRKAGGAGRPGTVFVPADGGGGHRPVGEERVDRWDCDLPGRDGSEIRERGGGITR